ncbi:hypothetical protein Hanom_Chr07g00670001 [Helianthus anomalus]
MMLRLRECCFGSCSDGVWRWWCWRWLLCGRFICKAVLMVPYGAHACRWCPVVPARCRWCPVVPVVK